ncbi:MAG: hypothetical protein ACM3N0_11950 [Chloroflexota bacterium]
MTMGGRTENRGSPISPESKEFLVALFAELRDDLNEEDAGAAEKATIYNALLAALDSGRFPDDERLREYVADLLRTTDEENGYEQAALEHRVFTELAAALGAD